MDIVASFHTHPNTGSDYLQEPSETDRRAVRDDAELKGKFYEGELVVAQGNVYLITPQGTVLELGDAAAILASA
jgi:proteasome lid subunit RPN8/RPN11